jgi:hypothetical protein
MTVDPQEPFETTAFQPPETQPVVVSAPRQRPRSRASSTLNIALVAAFLVAVAGVAFAVGRGTAPAAATGTALNGRPGAFGNGNGANGGGGGQFQNGGGPGAGGFGGGATGLSIEGTVTALDAGTVTIKTSAGATIQLSINGDTAYHQQAAANSADVKTGSTIVVRVDGFRGGFGRPGASASPGASGGAPTPAVTATDITIVP